MATKKNDAQTNSLNNLSKRGKKGGTRFPNYSLKQILPVLKEFISKTHSKPISIDQLNAGVFKFNSKSPDGGVKYSSMKQFGLANGEYTNITAKELASQIELSTDDDKIKYLREAFLNAPSFKNAFETFQSSTVSKSKIKSYSVQTIGIHIDLAEKFLKSLLESCELAKLCEIKGDEVTFISAKDISSQNSKSENDHNEDRNDNDLNEPEVNNTEDKFDLNEDDFDQHDPSNQGKFKKNAPNIALQIDSTLDPDKLAKQLRLLRKYGLI